MIPFRGHFAATRTMPTLQVNTTGEEFPANTTSEEFPDTNVPEPMLCDS